MEREAELSPPNGRWTEVITLERNGVTHVTAYIVTDGRVRIKTLMGEAEGPAKSDPQGEALRLFDRLVQNYEGNLSWSPGNAAGSA